MKNNGSMMMGSTLLAVLLIALLIRVPAIKVAYNGEAFLLKEKEFEIGWIHSVEKEPWFEKYKLEKGNLILTETRFKTFGAGTPSSGQTIPSDDGYVHMQINRQMEAVHLTVSKNVRTTLYTNDSTIPLHKLAGDHETIMIDSKKIPVWQMLRGEWK